MKKPLSESQVNYMRKLTQTSADVLLKYAYRFFGYQQHMQEVAEEAVQDTFLKAVEDVESLMKHPNPIGWLKVSLRNILLNIKREQHWKFEEAKEVIVENPEKQLYVLETSYIKNIFAQESRSKYFWYSSSVILAWFLTHS